MMKAKLAGVVFTVCAAAGFVVVRPWVARQTCDALAPSLEEGSVDVGSLRRSAAAQSEEQAPQQGRPVLAPKRTKIVTSEVELEKLMRRAMDLSVGEIMLVEGRLQKFVHDGKELLRGYRLSNASGAKTGAVAIAACDSDLKNIDDADLASDFKDGRLCVGTASLWLLHAGEKEKISPANVHADFPCISPDGTRVAYTARTLDAKGMPSGQHLYLYDTRSKQTFLVEVEHSGRVAPLYWEGESLAVYTGAMESPAAAVTFFKMPPAAVAAR